MQVADALKDLTKDHRVQAHRQSLTIQQYPGIPATQDIHEQKTSQTVLTPQEQQQVVQLNRN